MRIGLVVPGFSADAADWCIPALRNMVRQLALEDQVCVVALRYPPRAGRYRLFGAEIIALGGQARRGLGKLGLWRGALGVLAAEHRREKFDLLHAFWAGESGTLTAMAGRALRIPAVVSLAGGELVGLRDIGYGGQLARTERWKTRVALALAGRVTAGSRYLLDLAAEQLSSRGRARLRLAPLGVDLDLFRPVPPIQTPPRIRMVQVASLTPVKGQDTLLRAVARLRQWNLPVCLEVAGGGSLEAELRRLAKELALEDAVTFLGELPHDRLPSFYRGASLCLQSSRHESQGMAMLEAAACGVPLAGTSVGVLRELSPMAAAAVPVGDHQALAAAAAELLCDPGRLLRTGEAGRRRVEAEFGLDQSVRRFRDLYSEIIR
jgi:glycosyltransferase involved in cell wall biosynthesis